MKKINVALFMSMVVLMASSLVSCTFDDKETGSVENVGGHTEVNNCILLGYINRVDNESILLWQHTDATFYGRIDSTTTDSLPQIFDGQTSHVAGTTPVQRVSPQRIMINAYTTVVNVEMNNGISYNVTVKPCLNVLSNDGPMTAKPLDTLFVVFDSIITINSTNPNGNGGFYQEAIMVESLVNQLGIVLDTTHHSFIVEQGYVPPAREYLYSDTAWACGSVLSSNYNSTTKVATYRVNRIGTITKHYSDNTTEPGGSVTEEGDIIYDVTFSGTATTSMLGAGVLSGNTFSWGNGAFTMTLTPRSGWDWSCSHSHTNATLASNGNITVNGKYNGYNTQIIPHVNIESRHITSIDSTDWACGTVVSSNYVWSFAGGQLVYRVTRQRTLTKHYNLAPLTETITQRDTTDYIYDVTFSGTATTAMLGAGSVSGNTISWGNGAFTMTLNPHTQAWCPHTHTGFWLGMTNITVSGNYNSHNTSVNINIEVENPPIPGEFPNAVYAAVVDRYWAAVVSNLSSRETDLVVIEPYGSDYKVLWGEWSATLTRSQCDSTTITADDYTWLVGKVAAGYTAVMVPSHSNSSQHFGAVKSEQVGGDDGYWKLTYDIVAGNAYVMSNSAWTLAGYNGRNAQRGVMTSTGSITADGITRQLQ